MKMTSMQLLNRFASTATLSAMVAVAGVGSAQAQGDVDLSDDGEKGNIAILVNSLDNPYYSAEATAAEARAEELGYAASTFSHNEDLNRQRDLITSVVGQGVDGIVLDNADSSASVAAVRYATERDVPVVLINREIPEDGIAIAQLTHNNNQAASQVAQAFIEKVGESGKYVELTCNLADNNCVARSNAYHRILDQYPDLEMVARQDAGGELVKARQSMQSILQSHPDIVGVIAGNGPVALGAISALESAGMDDVTVVGIDGSNDERDAVLDGQLYATSMLQAQELARQGVNQLHQYLETGETGESERQLFRSILITEDNAESVNNFEYKDN
ncbi:substrate-binding domain-containing protein [Halomonas sp. A40-4]|uniref:substrate-binding domain-containing protein n=1 Tax=Halomonas sp. A40-4 TaxID=2785909 RepID=UPI0018F048E0|nr:substrate-binding domain-containing protein [Halomonas sp. A40-4]